MDTKQAREIRFLIYVVIAAVTAFFVYTKIYKEKIPQVQSKQWELAVIKSSLKEKEETLEEFNKVAASYKTKQKELAKVNKLVLEETENKFVILIHFDMVASANGMVIEGFSTGEVQNLENELSYLPVSFTVKGKYDNFRKMLNSIAKSLPLMEITKAIKMFH